MKPSLKDFIWLKMAEGNNPTDQDVYNFLGKEPDYNTVSEYKRQYYSFQSYVDYFKEYETNPNTRIHSYVYKINYTTKTYKRTRYYLTPHKDFNSNYKISKAYFNYLKGKGVVEDKP